MNVRSAVEYILTKQPRSSIVEVIEYDGIRVLRSAANNSLTFALRLRPSRVREVVIPPDVLRFVEAPRIYDAVIERLHEGSALLAGDFLLELLTGTSVQFNPRTDGELEIAERAATYLMGLVDKARKERG